MKRYTYYPQVMLGAAFSWGMPMAFTAQTGELPAALWLLYLANLLWTVAYDTYYAMVDRDDDLKIGVKSTAILFGDADRLIIASLQGLALLCLLLAGARFRSRRLLLQRFTAGGRLFCLAIMEHPQPRHARLLCRVFAQSLGGTGDFSRHSRRLRTALTPDPQLPTCHLPFRLTTHHYDSHSPLQLPRERM